MPVLVGSAALKYLFLVRNVNDLFLKEDYCTVSIMLVVTCQLAGGHFVKTVLK